MPSSYRPKGSRSTFIDSSKLSAEATSAGRKFEDGALVDKSDLAMGFARFESGIPKFGWLINMHPTTIQSDVSVGGLAAVDFYFLDDEGGSFKATVQYDPYFLVSCVPGHEIDVEEYLRRLLTQVKRISRHEKEDLSLTNHLVGEKRIVLKFEFNNINDLLAARKVVMPLVNSNKASDRDQENFGMLLNDTAEGNFRTPAECILDIYEYDVPYHVRLSIDRDIRVGKWYKVEAKHGTVKLTEQADRIARADPVVMAYDIETTKLPLKFPDATFDKIMMISYMIDGEGFLIINREIVSKDIEDFEYTPKPEFKGEFCIFNEVDERALLERFFSHIREEKPTIIATFNGDFFDWPFVEARAAFHGMDMFDEIGFRKDSEGEYKSTHCVHMDCFRWVQRDSYLPQGSQGLKAVTTAKLGYNPIEVDPELMTPYAIDKPQVMAEYSVSDAVATYYLYMKYVHPFIFSLCTIIPLNPDEVLRKGTGTLCEMLLMVQAYKGNIIFPHKHTEPLERFFEGHLIESETYVGGHVESLEAGVFRSDIPSKFSIDPTAVDEILTDLDDALKFAIEVENHKKLGDVENYDEVKNSIAEALIGIKEQPIREEEPLIYHVDVASMYPNIMTTNRLQPDSIVTEHDCARCDLNVPGKKCDRRLPWSWRGEYSPAKKDEYLMIRRTLESEKFPLKSKYNVKGRNYRLWEELGIQEQAALIKARLNEYSKKVYHRTKQSKTIEREAIICQKENPFYVDTVRSFRDRRYEFKGLQKVWKGKVADEKDAVAKEEAKKMVVLYDSLQLAHKVILNSFYGYVMRKGSRWYSMPMAGVTCLTGATIIQMARALVERLGRPLELDTDGIWCILPKSFPEDFTFKLRGGKKLVVSYPCVMLNHLVHARFTNDQYHTLNPDTNEYDVSSDNSIFFEVDGPYRAMILPTSKEEDKNLKKRYAVFNDDGTLAELKGFEIKRRGELRIIKAFQSQIFSVFLQGNSLKECYDSVAKVANSWLDILSSKGSTLEDEDLMDLISENRSMSKQLEEYEGQKSTSICTARRLAEFLGMQMVKDKGLACKYIISKKPVSSPVSERAIPVAIFSAELSTKSHYLRKWLKDPSLDDFDPRSILDWGYYWERLGSTIQKIITIPAALQNIPNPVPRVEHPEWLRKRLRSSKVKQQSIVFTKATATDTIRDSFASFEKRSTATLQDIEDVENIPNGASAKSGRVVKRGRKRNDTLQVEEEYPSLPSKVPSTDNYKEWLKYNKVKWAIQKQARNTRTQLFGDGNTKSGSAMANMVQDQYQNTYMGTVWHILDYEKTSTPGELRALVLIHDTVQRIRINVPRRIYISVRQNFSKAIFENLPAGSQITASNKKIAAATTVRAASIPTSLYELVLPEREYQSLLTKPNNVLKHRAITGIYESQVEPQDRAIIELGSMAVLNRSEPGTLAKGLEKGFELSWLRPFADEHNTQTKYLASIPDFIHLYHLISGDISIISLIPSWKETANLFVLRPGSQNGLSNVTSCYADELNKLNQSQDPVMKHYQSAIEFEQHLFSTNSDSSMYRKLSSVLSALYSERGTRAVVCIQSPVASKLRRWIRPLNEFANIEIGSRQATPLPALLWQKSAAVRVVKSYLKSRSWLAHRINGARQAKIPIGNLGDVKFAMDVLYGRKLMQHQIVLWWSRSSLSDHGGAEKDVLVNKIADSQSVLRFNNPGVYARPCIEISLGNTVVNATLTHLLEVLNEPDSPISLEAVAALVDLLKSWWQLAASNDESTSLDGDSRAMLSVSEDGQRFADSLVQNFVPWLCTNGSLLYDGGLHDYINNLTRQSFVRILADFKKLGVSVVFADNSRIIVSTNKNSVRHTYAFAEFLVMAIRAKPNANYLDMSVRKYWETLLWMDEFNYGGYFYESLVEDATKRHVSFWHMSKFLPELLSVEFETYVTMFGQRVRTAGMQLLESASSTRSSADINSQTQQQEKAEDQQRKSVASFVFDDIQKMLTKRLNQLFNKYNDSLANPDLAHLFQLPVRAGSHAGSTSNALLLFVQCISRVFELWDYLSLESRLVKRSLLRILSLSEFSPEAEFVDPSASLVVPDIICQWCGTLSSLDLCKQDADDVGNVGVTAKLHVWNCQRCKRPFSRVELEELLIKQIQRDLARFHLQDLKCCKCHKIREDNMALSCACSGEYLETFSRESASRLIETYIHVGRFYSMNLLEDALTCIY